MDSKIKLWEVYGARRLLRTFSGHSQAIRDIQFNHDGTQFLSCSYDKSLRLWDTETGECLRKFNTRKMVYAMKWYG